MRYLLYILIILYTLSCKPRPIIVKQTNFSIERPKLSDIDTIEQRNGGLRIYNSFKISVSKDYFPNADKFSLGQPLIFLRDTSTLRTQVTYFFSEPDSVVRLIEYSWNSSQEGQNLIEPLYESNKKTFNRLIQNLTSETVEINETWSQHTVNWEKDSVYVKQFIFIQGKPLRTRVLISWKSID